MGNERDERAARLAGQLRANLRKRKEQSRGRPAGDRADAEGAAEDSQTRWPGASYASEQTGWPDVSGGAGDSLTRGSGASGAAGDSQTHRPGVPDATRESSKR